MLHPVLVELSGVEIRTHDVSVAGGVLVAGAVFAVQVRRRARLGRPVDDRIWIVVAGTLVGGAIFSRLGTWLQHLDLRDNATLVEQWAYGNRSILSGLVGAYAGALLAKRLCGYPGRTGDLFAPAVALGMVVGRVGCLLSELPGTPTTLPWGVTLSAVEAAQVPGGVAGVALHPSFAYEIGFHLLAFVLLLWLRDRMPREGDLLTLYLIAYAVFRFAVEFVRGNAVAFAGLTRPQLFLLACAPLVMWQVVRLWRRSRTVARAAAAPRMEINA
ncbi:MAG TPA: prolipoprotein diacylglyceryl transferase family protein [Actinoplanes sp.]|nr:prolipoprotein diacylglyceryl transferase family protein [Actinoplanes sp.]